MSRSISPAELAKHNTPESLWVAVDGDVYDLSAFKAHPGGVTPLEDVAGTDVSHQFALLHDKKVLKSLGAKFKIGKLEVAPAPAKPALKKLQPGLTGNTSHILPAERARATFDTTKMSAALYGGEKNVAKRKFVLHPTQAASVGYAKYDSTREELIERHVTDFVSIHRPFTLEGYRPDIGEVSWMSEAATNTGSLMPHYGLFVPTILGQGSDMQIGAWLPRALTFQMVGAYAQTELSHGSNVRGLQTVATYDKKTQQFIINSPSLGSTKWWNSNAGIVATHAAVYAQLILDGKEMGVHVFLVQLRDENHRFLAGITAGDVGVKMGDNGIDTSWIRFDNVRIPREHLFSKRQHVEPDGRYVKHGREGGGGEHAHYLTMMQARSGMVSIAGGKLSIACTIAARYSCVRHQGFVDSSQNASFSDKEFAVIDYQVQRYRVLKQVAIAYSMRANGIWMSEKMQKLQTAASTGGSLDDLQEIHASAAGLKGLVTKMASDGIEDLRKCCGGHGYLLNSGIAMLAVDYVWQATAEGDFVVMTLQTARYLLKQLAAARKGEALAPLTECLAPLRDPSFNPIVQARPPVANSIAMARDLDHLLDLFKFRSLVAIDRVGAHFDEAMKRPGAAFEEAFNSCALALATTAQSHCMYFMLRNFVEVVRQQRDEHVAAAMGAMCSLFALSEVLDGKQFGGLLDPREFLFCEKAVAAILDEQRGNVVALVDAFDWPDAVLNSTIGRYDGNVYEALFEAALNAPLNRTPDIPFKGYEVLRKSLDIEFLKLRNQQATEELRSNL